MADDTGESEEACRKNIVVLLYYVSKSKFLK